MGGISGQRKVLEKVTPEEGANLAPSVQGQGVVESRRSWISTRSIRPDARRRKTSDNSTDGEKREDGIE